MAYFASAQQDFSFAKPGTEEFNLKRYDKDTSANAVVLREFGTAYLSSSDSELIFEYHVRTKIFNSKEFRQGNIEIPIYKKDANSFEKLSNIKGITFYPDEQGLIRSSELDPKQIFTEKKAYKNVDVTKFAMPNLRDGCIIEYSYRLQSPFVFNFRKWEFQSDLPKIYSEYSPRIPAVYNYNISIRGPLKLSKNTGSVEKDCYSPGGGFKADCSKMIYAMEDIPAFKEEDYMTAASNFKSAMYFELSDYTSYNGVKTKLTKEWKDVDHELKTHEAFGAQLKKKDFFKDKISPLLSGQKDELDKAKLIYKYWQNWFKWNSNYGEYSNDGLKKAFETHTGNVGDINLSLVAAMNAADLDAEPVILSTRSNGTVNPLFPVLSDFNYSICKVNIGDKSYLLDATDPLLPFGLLPMRCINDKGRVMSFSKPSYWIDLKASQKESKTINLNLTINESGKAEGTIVIYSSGYEAYNKRNKIRRFNSTEEYVEDLDERMPKIKIMKSEILNLDTLDRSLSETYTIEMDVADKQDRSTLIFNPFFLDRVTENPFKLAERTYPVDMGAPSETRIMMTLSFPEKFEVISKIDPVGLALPDKGGKFIAQVSAEGNTLLFMNHTQLNKSIYSAEEYPYLKELFNKIVQSQQIDLVFKKKI